ncbi:MAG TPA: multiheme c-type cytochrome [Pirellulaceae bacterium]|nr:multiheme c-type cytochrome [Pirellulaceae bacterium]
MALVLTGQQLGYIEPCGCTGLENQKGGLARRHALLRQLTEERGWTVVPLDVGSQVRRFGKQAEIKFRHSADALRLMGYKAVALGADDLRLPADALLSGTNPAEETSVFVGSNVALISRDLQPTFTIIEAGGKRIGVTAVLGDKYEQRLQSDLLVHAPAVESLKSACTELKQSNCDLYVLLAHAPPEEARKIAEEVPIFDLVVVAGQTAVPSQELEAVPGTKTKLVQTGTKAMYAGVVGVFDDRDRRLRFESVPIDAKLADSPPMLKMLSDYQQQLQDILQDEGLEGLGLTPRPIASGRKFVGSEKCGQCHTKAFAIWRETPHAHATDSLVHPPNSRGSIARHFDPECLSCHVTGWEPQQFSPLESGYLSLEKTPDLQHNGCENCHGPGSAHVAAETGDAPANEAEMTKLRDEMKLPLAGGVAEKKCLECHDDDNSPDFHHQGAFDEYWKQVEHRGKD